MNLFRRLFILVNIIIVCHSLAAAQTDDEDLQSINDFQVSIPLNKKLDFVILSTLRFGNDLSKFTEGRIGSGVAWKANNAFTVTPAYLYIETRNSAGKFQTEHRYLVKGVYKFPVKKLGLSHRSQFEYRVRNSGNAWRYRPSITIEKDLPEKFIPSAKLFVTEEVFYDSRTGKFSRNRFSIGVNKIINTKLSLDIYYMRQNDGFSHPGDLNVIGTSWKIKL